METRTASCTRITMRRNRSTGMSDRTIINDFVGYFWFLHNGLKEVSPEVYGYVNKLEVCQGLLPKGTNAIFIGGTVNPFWWVEHH